MSRVFEVDPQHPEDAAEAVVAAADAIMASQLAIVPTETVYGILARPDERRATAGIFRVKQRPEGLNLPVLARSTERAWEIGAPNRAAALLAGAFWPGPLTLVLPRTERSRPWPLGDRGRSIGVRVPDHQICAALLERCGPLAATSANVSGDPPLGDGEALVSAFGSEIAVYLVLRAGAGAEGVASTVVDVLDDGLRVLRQGAITPDQLRDALGRPDTSGQSVDSG
jgi:tRNA threonylcarbamoyl adenosine modification protein (Sua5/YciO/YrdC/YwlC family)